MTERTGSKDVEPGGRGGPPEPSVIRHTDGGIHPDDLARRVFAGEAIAFHGLADAPEICARGHAILAEVIAPHDPERGHEAMAPPELKRRLLAVRKRFAGDPDIRALYERMLAEAGCNPETTYRDRLVLRVVPPVADLEQDTRVMLPPHRDTWGSGLLAQINWWMPIGPLGDGRTMVLYPGAWAKAVANNSEGWDWRRAREPGYPALPSSQCDLAAFAAEPVLIPAGTLLAFSGAHLHATQVNRTGAPRFSTDTRTISLRHIVDGVGAPDLDHGRVAKATAWFSRFGDGVALSDQLGDA